MLSNTQSRPKRAVPFKALRYLYSALMGLIDSLLYGSLQTLKMMGSKRYQMDYEQAAVSPSALSNNTLILLWLPLGIGEITFLSWVLHFSATRFGEWIDAEEKAITAEEAEAIVAASQPWSFKHYILYPIGFALGLCLAVFPGLYAVFHTPNPDNFISDLLKSPRRFISAFFATPFKVAEGLTNMSETGRLPRLPPPSPQNIQRHYKPARISDYPRLLLAGLDGFIYGALCALTLAIIKSVVYRPLSDTLFWSLALFLPRFLSAFFGAPFICAANCWADELQMIDHERHAAAAKRPERPPQYRNPQGLESLSLALSYFRGFIAGITRAIPTAAANVFVNKRYASGEDDLVARLYHLLFRFLKELAACPFEDAANALHEARLSLDHHEADPLLRRRLGSLFNTLARGGFALLLSVILSPLNAVIDFLVDHTLDDFNFRIRDHRPEKDDGLFAKIVFSPFRALKILALDTYSRVGAYCTEELQLSTSARGRTRPPAKQTGPTEAQLKTREHWAKLYENYQPGEAVYDAPPHQALKQPPAVPRVENEGQQKSISKSQARSLLMNML